MSPRRRALVLRHSRRAAGFGEREPDRPDGRLFVGMRNENEDEITRYSLVLNWTEELKRKMSAAR